MLEQYKHIEIDDISGKWQTKKGLQNLKDIDVPVNVFVTPRWFDGEIEYKVNKEMKIFVDRPEIFVVCNHGWDHTSPPEGYRNRKKQLEMFNKIMVFHQQHQSDFVIKMPGNKWNFQTIWAMMNFGFHFMIINQSELPNAGENLLYETAIFDLRDGELVTPTQFAESIVFHYGRDIDVDRINAVRHSKVYRDLRW